MMFHATQPLTCGSCVRINPEPGWLIDASGVLGEPALPRGLPNWRRFQGRARSPSAPHLGIVASLRITCVNQPPRIRKMRYEVAIHSPPSSLRRNNVPALI